MTPQAGGGLVYEHRLTRRSMLAVPVQFAREGGLSEALPTWTGRLKNISADGMYFVSGECEAITPGDLVRIALSIPYEQRRTVPFARMMGLCRVLRVDFLAAQTGGEQGIAVTFCRDRFTMIGTVYA